MKQKRLSIIYCILSLLAIISCSNTIYARFSINDADHIDQEESLSIETYNDKISYREPIHWEKLWNSHRSAIHLKAGSLNKTRFDHHERIKLQSNPTNPVFFTYNYRRNEDFIDQQTLQEVRLTAHTPANLLVAIMADGGTLKQFNDVGLSVTYPFSKNNHLELYFWGVDQFYTEKKDFPDDKLIKNTDTYGSKGQIYLGQNSKTLINFCFEYDTPLKWLRESKNYIYEYKFHLLNYNVTYTLSPKKSLYIKGNHHWKSEAKSWISDITPAPRKSFRRRAYIHEIGGIYTKNNTIQNFGFQYIYRNAKYSHINFSEEILRQVDKTEEASPHHSRRFEYVAYYKHYSPFKGFKNQFLEHGLHINKVRINEGRINKNWEIKIQNGWDYKIDKKTHIMFNLTWDIDQLSTDFPYDKTSFKPWGGGNFQVISYF